ncbi:glycine cleavage system protein GcvH [Gammaproteobacteria bacterium AH-315-C21]|nr:glycine cleavage system protein GcvH [Gammaproteobacteria bacterium AH-315-C21]
MSDIPTQIKYTKSHEWVEILDDGTVRIGITDHAQDLLGDMVFVELPEVGDEIIAGEESAVVESVKAASDVYSPLSGEITAINEAVTETPEIVNQSPYKGGWLFELKPSAETEIDDLLDADAYNELAEADSH